jgi:hypothetical protein
MEDKGAEDQIPCITAYKQRRLPCFHFPCSTLFLQCIGEIMTKHEVAKGSYKVLGVVEGNPTGIELKVRSPL